MADEYNEQEHLTAYVLNHCREFMLPEESDVLTYFRLIQATVHLASSSRHMLEFNMRRNEKTAALIDLGEQVAYEKIRDLVLERDPSLVNRCPSCGKVARTPKARQCQWCFFDWHEDE